MCECTDVVDLMRRSYLLGWDAHAAQSLRAVPELPDNVLPFERRRARTRAEDASEREA